MNRFASDTSRNLVAAPSALGIVPRIAIATFASALLLQALGGCDRHAVPHTPTSSAPAKAPTFVGSHACAACHVAEFHQWQGSHHALAMQPATDAAVLGDFSRVTFHEDGVSTTFFRDGKRFLVRTAGPDGKPHDYPIAYTFGVYPLQQYLIPLSRGRLQAFGIAWDSRPRSAGGQRWFALYPGAAPSSALNWTAPDQTWNYQCAACHSTDLHKNYDLATRSYATTYSEVSVGCEACHGPGSAHVAWAKGPHHHPQLAATEGLSIALDERKGVTWKTDPATALVERSRPRTSDREVQTCAECHARATQIHRDYVHGQPLGDDYRVALLENDLYFADGQIKGEVYEYGSFLQSRMFHAGVTCSDCHNPHTATLRAHGNRLCTGCHLADKYDTPRHTHHAVESAGAQCVACHMPTRTYMRIDARRDHSIRVPRPDLSVAIGTPNACNECHVHQDVQWAAEHITKWFGPHRIGFQHFADALNAGALGAPGSYRQLMNLVASSAQPAIARATAITLLAGYGEPQTATLLQRESRDPSALVRRATAEALANANPAEFPPFLRLLGDPVRSVRIAAADSLAGIDRKALAAPARDALDKASAEYLAAQRLDADRPEAHLDLALYFARQNRLGRAESELGTALSLDPAFVPAAVNLADLYRSLGQDDRAGQVLQASLKRAADDPALLFSLGLLDIRKGAKRPALELLQEASRNAPDNARYAYVYALALEDAGNIQAAIAVLERSLQASPYDRESLAALASFYTRIGNPAAAAKYQRVLANLTANP